MTLLVLDFVVLLRVIPLMRVIQEPSEKAGSYVLAPGHEKYLSEPSGKKIVNA